MCDSLLSFEKGMDVEVGEMGMLTARKWHREVKASLSSSGTSASMTATVTNLSPLSKGCILSRAGFSLMRESTNSPGWTLCRPNARETSAVGSRCWNMSGTTYIWDIRCMRIRRLYERHFLSARWR